MVQVGRGFYNSKVDQSKRICRELGITTLGWKDGVPMGHYSFDYAQNVHLPSTPCNVGHCISWLYERSAYLEYVPRAYQARYIININYDKLAMSFIIIRLLLYLFFI